nr:probable receptor-like protein kinase At1g80640 [Ipomoea batatas]
MNICPKAHTGSSPTEKEPIFQASASTCVHSPGATDVRAVQHQNLNKKILIALIVASTLLGGILLLLSGLWVYRLSKLKKSNEKWQQNAGEGRLGHVYKAKIDNDLEAAVNKEFEVPLTWDRYILVIYYSLFLNI